MQNVKLLQKRFPKHQRLIAWVSFVVGLVAVIIGLAIALWGR